MTERYVVLMYDPREDVVSTPLSYHSTKEGALAEVDRLRRQELPVYYCTEEYYRSVAGGGEYVDKKEVM